ncbi:MAG: glycosyltransferase family 1 protein [Desulfobacterales bacterium]
MPRALKIAVDTRPLSYPLTGIGVYVKFLLQALQQADQVNHYLLISNGPICFELANPRWRKIEGSITKRLFSTLWMQLLGPWAAIRHRIDLFWSPRHHLPLLLPAKIPSILTIHDLTYRFYPHTMTRANYWVERLLMPPSALRAQRIVTDARATARDLTRTMGIPAAKIRVIYPGPPGLTDGKQAERPRKLPDLPRRYFLFVGTLDPRKNFAGLFEAFARLNPEKKDLHLVIVGASGWKNQEFHAMLKHHPTASRLLFTGYVSRDQLQIIYERAIALVFPSFYEGFGFPILEAMAAGTPVITADRSSLPEVAGNGAIQVDPHDIPALTRAMRRVYSSPDLRRNLIAGGRIQYRNFSWEGAAQQMLRVFQEVAGA